MKRHKSVVGRMVMNTKSGRHLFPALLFLVPLLSGGCISSESGGDQKAGPSSRVGAGAAKTFVYECGDDNTFTVRVEGESAWLFLPQGSKRLPSVPSGSGAKFSDGSATYWGKGEEALLELDGKTYRACVNNRRMAIWEDAKLRGVDFRALGNEPGWYLEISEGNRLLLVDNYGQDSHEFVLSEPSVDSVSHAARYQALSDVHQLTLTLEGRRCTDSMSGESFETTVTLMFDDRRLSGCGKSLH